MYLYIKVLLNMALSLPRVLLRNQGLNYLVSGVYELIKYLTIALPVGFN